MYGEPSNEKRAEWAEVAIAAFAAEVRMHGEESETIITDLLCDLMHFCNLNGIDFQGCVEMAEGNYREELADEAEESLQ